jgi:hypothetical protein
MGWRHTPGQHPIERIKRIVGGQDELFAGRDRMENLRGLVDGGVIGNHAENVFIDL